MKKIIEQFPIVSYEEDRERDGRLEKIYDKEVKNLADGVVYKKSLYRKGNGQDVWCYITEVSPKANVSFAVSAGPLKKIAPVLSRAEEFDGNVLFAMNAGFSISLITETEHRTEYRSFGELYWQNPVGKGLI